MLTYGIPPEFRGGVHMKPPYAIGSVPRLSGHAVAYRWRSLPRVRRHRASKPQGSSERVLPWQIAMDQLIFASLSHTHYWYEVGMLKVPAVCMCYTCTAPSVLLGNVASTETICCTSSCSVSRRSSLVGGRPTSSLLAQSLIAAWRVWKGVRFLD